MASSSSINHPQNPVGKTQTATEAASPSPAETPPVESPSFIYDRSYDQKWKRDLKGKKWNLLEQGVWGVPGESPFERLLKDCLDGLRQSVTLLKQGIKACFRSKKDHEWRDFYNNVAREGSVGQKAELPATFITEIIFRGLYADDNGLSHLVCDVHAEPGGRKIYKFARLMLDAPTFLLLKNLPPASPVPLNALCQGRETISLTKLVHAPQEPVLESMMEELKKPMSGSTLRRLERALSAHGAQISSEPENSMEPAHSLTASGSAAKPWLWAIAVMALIGLILIRFVL